MQDCVAKVKLTKGKVALVDSDYLASLGNKSWCYHSAGYACRRSADGKIELMHRLITQAKKGEYVDHINNNKLDNRQCNLRIVSNAQNLQRSVPKNGIKGVGFHKQCQKWRARFRIDGKEISLGLFNTKIEAIKAYNKIAKETYGEHAWLNKTN
jgi:hypothetical protein